MTSVSIKEVEARAVRAEKQLLAVELADAKAKQEKREKELASNEARAAAQRAEALAAEIEETRVGSWVLHRLTEMQRNGNPIVDGAALRASIPKHQWPPGVAVSDFHFKGLPGGQVAQDPGDNSLTRMLAAKGIKF